MEHTCKGCGAPIIWIRTVKGKQIPCDPKMLTIVTSIGQTYKGYQSHFATCPKADEFRKTEAEKVAAKIRGRTVNNP